MLAPHTPVPTTLSATVAPGLSAAMQPSQVAAEVEECITPKRKPGRPPNKPPVAALIMRGVLQAPVDPDNRLEFVFGNPTAFKALFAYFKNINAREINLRCRPDGLTFFARDHAKTSRIVAHIAGAHVNLHYCESEFWLGINREHVEKMFASIDKTIFKISIIQTIDDPDSLLFVLKNMDLDKECNYKVVLSEYSPDIELFEAETEVLPALLAEKFPIQFTLSAKQFKKSIGDANNCNDKFTYEKMGNHPLTLTCSGTGILYTEVYRSPEKINLVSNIESDAIFRCTVKISNIKSLANSMVTDDVCIMCRTDGDILFRSAVDEKALVINALTKLV
jgi:hypothetical protein